MAPRSAVGKTSLWKECLGNREKEKKNIMSLCENSRESLVSREPWEETWKFLHLNWTVFVFIITKGNDKTLTQLILLPRVVDFE